MATWEELEARRDELRAREDELMKALPTMDPLVGARAFSTLADEKATLAPEYEEFLKRKREERDG